MNNVFKFNIGGEERPVKFGINQSALYCKFRYISVNEMNKELQNISKGEIDGTEVRDLIWSALKDGARFEKIEFNYDNLDVGDWLEDLSVEQLTDFLKNMASTMPDKKIIKKKNHTKVE